MERSCRKASISIQMAATLLSQGVESVEVPDLFHLTAEYKPVVELQG